MIFTNTGELLLRVRRPGHDILESLARFSRARRHIDDWHFDVAVFPTERLSAWRAPLGALQSSCAFPSTVFDRRSAKPGATLTSGWPLIEGLALPLLPFAHG